MKTQLLSLLSLCIIIASCSSDESSPLDILEEAQTGAVVVAVETQNNSITGDTASGSLEVLLEYTDGEQGALLDKMNVYATFFDQSADGDSSAAITDEVLLRTVEETSFEIGINDLPTYQMTITAQEFLAATNNTNESIAIGDEFFTRLELVLTDGRTFSFAESDQFGVGVATFIFETPVN
jgi:hypothetical protein